MKPASRCGSAVAAAGMLVLFIVCVAGYGEAACGYIPTDRHIAEQAPNLTDWSWVAPGSEGRVRAIVNELLSPDGKREHSQNE